ncbi:unnamed protein product [Heterobilharzia americana]|nr:unnamed protein product [Heterobilharzia americana]
MLLAARKIATEDLNSTSSGRTASSVLNQVQLSNDTSTSTQSSQVSSTSNLLGCQRLNSNTDLLFKARQLGIKILTIDTVTKWIKNLPSDVQSFIQSSQRADNEDHLDELTNDPERDRIHEVRHLVNPCIKVIDTKNHYRPIYLDKTDYLPDLWNTVNRYKSKSKSALEVGIQDCPSSPMPITTTAIITTTTTAAMAGCSGSVPGASVGFTFQNPSHHIPGTGPQSVLTRKDSRAKRKHRLQKHNTGTPLQRTASLANKGTESNPKANSTAAAVDDEPSGYCECCSMNFKSLFEHLHCTDHQQFANNSENYRLLDDVLNKLPTLKEFLEANTSCAPQCSAYLNPIAISPCDSSRNQVNYMLNISKHNASEKENISPVEVPTFDDITESIIVSEQPDSLVVVDENPFQAMNDPPVLNFSQPSTPIMNQFIEDDGSEIFSNHDLIDVCEISKTGFDNDGRLFGLDEEETAFLYLL